MVSFENDGCAGTTVDGCSIPNTLVSSGACGSILPWLTPALFLNPNNDQQQQQQALTTTTTLSNDVFTPLPKSLFDWL